MTRNPNIGRVLLVVAALIAGVPLASAPALAQQGTTTGHAADVHLFPGDIVRVEVWREPDLSGEFLVGEHGSVVLPLIGEVIVSEMPVAAVRDSLLSAYGRELRNPSINITPLRRIYVLGEVNRPGLMNIDPTISLAGAIALAGGANPVGDLNRVKLIRDGAPLDREIGPDHILSALDVRSGDQIFVGRRSWFERNSTFVVSALLSVTSIIVTLAK